MALAHVGGGAQWVLSTYGLQLVTEDHIRGRVLSLDFGLATFAIGISSLGAGGLAELVGLRYAAWTLVAVGLLYGGTWLFFTRRLWGAATDPLRG